MGVQMGYYGKYGDRPSGPPNSTHQATVSVLVSDAFSQSWEHLKKETKTRFHNGVSLADASRGVHCTTLEFPLKESRVKLVEHSLPDESTRHTPNLWETTRIGLLHSMGSLKSLHHTMMS